MKGYYDDTIDTEYRTEISRGEAERLARESGIENSTEYCDDIEAGRYGSCPVQVAFNVYYGEME